MSKNTTDLREQLEDIGFDIVDNSKAHKATALVITEREYEKLEALISNREKLLLDLYQKDMRGYDFTPADYEGGEDTNALVADALKNSRAYVERTLRKELDGGQSDE